ncbi:MAG: cell division protein FtsZ [Clostridiales bacterium]|nr:cell division protein FtsZ [Clostridiales bacterium]
MQIEYDKDEFISDINIKVFGVGGGGGNALEYMANQGVENVEYIAVNTDVKALRSKNGETMRRIQIGKKKTKGRGAGNDPSIGAESAIEDKEEIQGHLKGATMVFISAGMGGGTGTGAAPIIASLAKEMDILTVGVVTKPFDFEREQKMNQALKGIAEMRNYVDALVIIPNQKLLKMHDKALNLRQAFSLVDDILYKAVKSISDLVTSSGYVNVDFADVEATLKNAGDAHMAIGFGTGENKADEAVKEVINSPLLETTINGAGRILVNITMSPDTTMEDTDKVMQQITKAALPDVRVISGISIDDDMQDSMVLTVIATGFETPVANAEENQSSEEEVQEQGEPKAEQPQEQVSLLDDLIESNKTKTDEDIEDDRYKEIMKLFNNK